MTDEDRAEIELIQSEIRDALLNAEARPGGPIGLVDEKRRTEILVAMRIVGWIGPKGGLTVKGAARARNLQFEKWGT